MTYFAAVLSAVCLGTALRALGILPLVVSVIGTTLRASRIHQTGLSDAEKERLLRKASLTLMGSFLVITGRTAAAIAVSGLPLLGLHAYGLVSSSALTDVLTTWHGIVLTGIAVSLGYYLRIRG